MFLCAWSEDFIKLLCDSDESRASAELFQFAGADVRTRGANATQDVLDRVLHRTAVLNLHRLALRSPEKESTDYLFISRRYEIQWTVQLSIMIIYISTWSILIQWIDQVIIWPSKYKRKSTSCLSYQQKKSKERRGDWSFAELCILEVLP